MVLVNINEDCRKTSFLKLLWYSQLGAVPQNQWKCPTRVLKICFPEWGNSDGKALLFQWEGAGLASQWSSPHLCSAQALEVINTSCLWEAEALICSIITVTACYHWLSRPCQEPHLIAVGSPSSHVPVCSMNNGTAAGSSEQVQFLASHSMWNTEFGCSPSISCFPSNEEFGNEWDCFGLSPWKMPSFPECVDLGNNDCSFSSWLLTNYACLRHSWNKLGET